MKDYRRQRSAMQQQGRKRGICRNSANGNPEDRNEKGYRGSSWRAEGGAGYCRGFRFSDQPSSTDTSAAKQFFTSNLTMLKEQAMRLRRALQEVEAQIKDHDEQEDETK